MINTRGTKFTEFMYMLGVQTNYTPVSALQSNVALAEFRLDVML